MKIPVRYRPHFVFLLATLAGAVSALAATEAIPDRSHYRQWVLPQQPAHPADNAPTPARVELGRKLFHDPRLSRDRTMACASCHNPLLGWSDGLPTARGHHGKLLARATPSIVNSAFNTIQMWDGRKKDLEDQAMGPLENDAEMNADMELTFAWLAANSAYRQAFARAYPGEPIGPTTLRKAIASFERTVISRKSPFDLWVAGDQTAMTARQLRGMAIFMSPSKGNCIACHSAPNFTDNGFHNLGLASHGVAQPDLGRFAQKAVPSMRGAFKTPSLRDVEYTAPYFHDGSAKTLREVVEHYVRGGVVKADLSPNMRALRLSESEKEELVAFMKALSSPRVPVVLPVLPQD